MEVENNGVDGSGKSIDPGTAPLRVNGRFVSRKSGGSGGTGTGESGEDHSGAGAGNRGTESGGDRGNRKNSGREDGSGRAESGGIEPDSGSESRGNTGPGTAYFRNGKPKKSVIRSIKGTRVSVGKTPGSIPFTEAETDEVTRAKKTASGSKLVNGKPGDLMLENITALMLTGFQLAASSRGAHWNIDMDEAESIARPLTNILLALPGQSAKQAQKLMNTVAAPLALFGAVSGIVIGRLKTDAQIQAQVDAQVAARLAQNGGINNGIPTAQTQNVYRPENSETGPGQSAASIPQNDVRNEAGISSILGTLDPVFTGGR